jgi:hypothetical protein
MTTLAVPALEEMVVEQEEEGVKTPLTTMVLPPSTLHLLPLHVPPPPVLAPWRRDEIRRRMIPPSIQIPLGMMNNYSMKKILLMLKRP